MEPAPLRFHKWRRRMTDNTLRIIFLLLWFVQSSSGTAYNGKAGTEEAPPTVAGLTYESKLSPNFVFKDPTYLIIAPKTVHAGQTYRLVMNILAPSPPLQVKATLYRNNIQIHSVDHRCHSSEPRVFSIKVPPASTNGNYRLKLEGNELDWLTGSAFTNETNLLFSPRGATVLIQIDKPFYKQGSIVRIRVVALDSEVQMLKDSVDVFLLSPMGVMVKRWLSRQGRDGAISLELPLSKEAELGEWTVRVEATNSFAEKKFYVDGFQDPLFQVRVKVPSFLSSKEDYLEGVVSANYSSGAPVSGNVTVAATMRPMRGGVISYYTTGPMLKRKQHKFTGIFRFRFHLDELSNVLVWSKALEVNVTATVGDALLDCSQTGFAITRIYGSKISLNFLGESPSIMRPSMPFGYYLSASMQDGSHVSEDRLVMHRLLITPEVHFKSGGSEKLPTRNIKMAHDQYGLWADEIDVHEEFAGRHLEENVIFMILKAELKDAYGSKSFASMVAVTHHSLKGRQIQVTTSTRRPKVGEYIILHVRSSFYLESFRYILMSKGVIIDAGQEKMEASLKTLPIALTSAMAGMSTILIYAAERGKDIVADALTFPVDAFTTASLEVNARQVQAEKEMLEISVRGQPGSFVSLSGIAWDTLMLKAGSDLTEKQIVDQMKGESRLMQLHRIDQPLSQEPFFQGWADHDGPRDQSRWLARGSLGGDAKQTFDVSGFFVLSDGGVPERPNICLAFKDLKSCLVGSCYDEKNACDGKWDCIDRSDEKSCQFMESRKQKDLDNYRLRRQSLLSHNYEDPWLWKELTLDENGQANISLPIPERTSKIALTAYGLHSTTGLTILHEPQILTTSAGFWLWVEAPSEVGQWEQVGIRVTAVNHHPEDVRAAIILSHNPRYKFVSLEEFELAKNYIAGGGPFPSRPIRRMMSGEHEHSITVEAGKSHTLLFPIVPTVLGEISVVVEASLLGVSGPKISKEAKIFVQPSGAQEERHTSLMLDLSHRAYLFTFMDVRLPPGHVEGSASSRITLFGDIVGGVSTEGGIFSPSGQLGLPNEGCDAAIFSFLMTILQLSQWEELRQPPQENHKGIFDQLSLLYQTILSYQNNDGGFRYFKSSSTSCVWLTSLALRALNKASNSWPQLLYIDPQVTDRAIRYLLKQQTENGAFWEPSGAMGVRQLEQPLRYALNELDTGNLNLSSTAFVLMQLLSVKQLPEPLDDRVHKAMIKGRMWLEDNLDLVMRASKPLEVALISFILQKMSSPLDEEAFCILARNARLEAKYMYWGEDRVSLPSYRVESMRPQLQPRQIHRHDSSNIAATALALRVYAGRGELLTPAIVRWINTQRVHDAGWMSTLDTLFAWEALHEYSQKKETAHAIDVTVSVETLNNFALPKIFYINRTNILQLQKHNLGNLGGSLRVQCKGNGSAILQLTTRYHISERSFLRAPPERAFTLRTLAISGGRNASSLIFNTCIRWTYLSASDTSGITVLEQMVPTGYGLHPQQLEAYVRSRKVPYLRKATFETRKVSFFFQKIGKSDTCVEFTVQRWFPVANLTKVLLAKVYEFYAPELYGEELLDMSSITLDICQVCGSYQCPNCPILSYYSSGSQCSFKINFNIFHVFLPILFYLVKEHLMLNLSFTILFKPR